jgi:hypothetical protein
VAPLCRSQPTRHHDERQRFAIRCPSVNRFAGEAVFAYVIPTRDKGAVAIASSLDINAYPTITVLEPEARMLLERGRINGFQNATPLGMYLETILWDTPPREFEGGSGIKAPVGPPPSTADAESGAAREPLLMLAPAPQCR